MCFLYIPTYYRLKKTQRSIESIIESANKSKYDIAIYIGDNNTKLADMKSWLQSLAQSDKVNVFNTIINSTRNIKNNRSKFK